MSALLILGAGGHGKSVADAAVASGKWKTVAFADDGLAVGALVMGLAVVGKFSDVENLRGNFPQAVVALGNNSSRRQVQQKLEGLGFALATVIHPAAIISPSAKLGEGTAALAGAIVNACAEVGRGCILNTACSVDHDCVIGEFSHISPGARLGGAARVGDLCWLCMNSTVINGISVANGCVLAAGSALLGDTEPKGLYAGIPAIKKKVYA